MINILEFRYITKFLRITTRSDPARGGKRVETMVNSSRRTVLLPDGIRKEMTKKYWKDIGTVMDAPTNVVREQPKSLAQKLVERMAERQDKIITDALIGRYKWDQVDLAIADTGREKTGGGTIRTATDFVVNTAGDCKDVRNG